MRIGERVISFRKKREWSQQDLAEKAGLAMNTIQKIEQKKAICIRLETIQKIAEAFEVSIDTLVKY